MHACTYVCPHLSLHVCVSVYIYACMHVCMYACLYVCCTYTCIHTYTYTYTYAYAYTYTHTYLYLSSLSLFLPPSGSLSLSPARLSRFEEMLVRMKRVGHAKAFSLLLYQPLQLMKTLYRGKKLRELAAPIPAVSAEAQSSFTTCASCPAPCATSMP